MSLDPAESLLRASRPKIFISLLLASRPKFFISLLFDKVQGYLIRGFCTAFQRSMMIGTLSGTLKAGIYGEFCTAFFATQSVWKRRD